MAQDADRQQELGSGVDLQRRRALARLGLAIGAAYVAPVILHLEREAKAKAPKTPCPPPGTVPCPSGCTC